MSKICLNYYFKKVVAVTSENVFQIQKFLNQDGDLDWSEVTIHWA